MIKEAIITPCKMYRYELSRKWGDGDSCVFVGLNPSTADENEDDPTIRRCIRFAQDWGYGKLIMLNAYGYRSTKPEVLKTVDDPIGNRNDRFLKYWHEHGGIIIAAWGVNIELKRQKELIEIFNGNLYYLTLTKGGYPGHPLYLSKTSMPTKWVV